jgi:hypothetical protein
MKKLHGIILLLLFYGTVSIAQDWSLKLSSNVGLRTYTLTNKAEKKEKSLQGATISLYKWSSLLSQTTSDANGDFVIDVPPRGDFVLTISFEGCSTKKFYVSTNNVPENVGKDNYKPTISIGGFVISKPITGVDYLGLNNPLLKIEYKEGGQNFDKDDKVTTQGIAIVSKITASENYVIEKFCEANKLGDAALAKKKCQIALDYYKKARKLIPEEKYPIEQIEKAEECLKNKKDKEDAIAEEAAEKAAVAKIATDKAIKEKQIKNNEPFKKATNTSTISQNKSSTEQHKTIVSKPVEQKSTENKNSGKSKYKMPGKLAIDKYAETIDKADVYFKTKRYAEAKEAYSEALKLKAKDNYAAKKIVECDTQLTPKTEKLN